MKLTIVLLIGIVFACASPQSTSGQVQGIVLEQPLAVSVAPAMQTFTYLNGSGNSQVAYFANSYSPYGGGSGGYLNSLNDPSVMKDLELVDEQMSKIADIRLDFNKHRKEIWKTLSQANKRKDKEGLKKLQERLAELQTEQNDALSDVLLPHQLDRIKQVSHQLQMQNMGGASAAFQHGQLAKELDVTDEQKKKLAEIQNRMNEDIIAKTKELRDAARKQAMEQLTAEQKAKFKALTGEEFKRDPKDWQEHNQRSAKRRNKD